MSTFLQFHILTSYPPSNLNRDDIGRPKTAVVGGRQRLRISSQSLKRAWRTSDTMKEFIGSNLGKRTRRIGSELVIKPLLAKGVEQKLATECAKAIGEVFGKINGKPEEITKFAGLDSPKFNAIISDNKKENETIPVDSSQLVHLSPEELNAIAILVEQIAATKKAPTEEELHLLKSEVSGVDIALFGRMLASAPEHNMDAAAQVAHAITVHEVAVEDDYFTAVDDLNKGEDSGAGHIGELAFGAGVYYLYICVNVSLLAKNLHNTDLARRSLIALLHTAAKIAPSGKQNSFASRAYSSYILLEEGNQQPRSLHTAFLHPVKPQNNHGIDAEAIRALEGMRTKIDNAYGQSWNSSAAMDVTNAKGTFAELEKFLQEIQIGD